MSVLTVEDGWGKCGRLNGQHRHVIVGEALVMRDYGQSLRERLSNQYAVEGVIMMSRQLPCRDPVRDADWQWGESAYVDLSFRPWAGPVIASQHGSYCS